MKYGKSLILLLSLLFLFSISFPSTVNADNNEPKKLYEITELRESNVKAYQLDNGQIQCDVYAIDVHYKDQQGMFKDIDNSIKDAEGKNGYRYANTANSWYTFFADNLSTKSAVVLEKDDYSISFYLQDSNKANIVQKSSSVLDGEKCFFEKTLAEDNRAVVYKDVYENVDIVYTVKTTGLKEDIILRDKTAQNTFVFNLELKGLNLIQEEERTYFANEDGKEIFSISPMFMEDANEKRSNNVSYEIFGGINSFTLVVTADKDFLNSPDTVYPVRIDPTFNTTGPSYTSDTFVADGPGRQDDNYYLYDWLRTGEDTTYGERRTYIRFKLPSGYRYDGITAATLSMKLYSKGSEDVNIRARENNGYWKSSEITWENRPLLGAGASSVSTVSNNWYTMNVLNLIQNCYYQDKENFGFMVMDMVTNDTDVWGTFYSSDHSSSSYRPVLSITYTNITGYQTFSGDWTSGLSDDLNVYMDGGAYNYFGSEINAVYDLWNGIDSDFNIDSINVTGDPDDYEIVVKGVTSLDNGVMGLTTFYNSNRTKVYPWNGDDWSYVIIELNINPGQLLSLHEDLQKEIILHEFGHAAGLAHVNAQSSNSSVCIMVQYQLYCYPSTTSHDRQTLDSKY